jgi:hypothetical protein
LSEDKSSELKLYLPSRQQVVLHSFVLILRGSYLSRTATQTQLS